MSTQKATSQPSQNTYSVTRVETSTPTGVPVRLWTVNVKRHKRLFARNFYDAIYGGRESAWIMAVAYRDALMQLFPPLTQRDQRTKVRANNKSGVPGVMAKFDNGRLKAWVATLEVSGVIHQKYFSVRELGDEKAKELAIEARQAFLAQRLPNRFVTVNPTATQKADSTFPQLLSSDPIPGNTAGVHAAPDAATVDRQLELLNAWFDALRPQFVHVRLSVYPIARKGYDSLFVVVGDGSAPGALQRKSWTIQDRSYQDVVSLAWQYLQATLTAQMGAACWREFEERWKETVFASTPDQAVFIRYRYDPPGGPPLRTTPPAELIPMLADIAIPELPAPDTA